MKEIWDMQSRLQRAKGRKPETVASAHRFRAAYDFVLLREECGEDLKGLGEWWTDYQDTEEYKELDANRQPEPRHVNKRRPRRNNQRRDGQNSGPSERRGRHPSRKSS